MRLRDILVLFGPLALVILVGGGVLLATIEEAMRRERDLENELLLTAARGHFARSLRLMVADLARTPPDGASEADILRTMEEHAFVHGFLVHARLLQEGTRVPSTPGPHVLRLWMPLDSDRRLVTDVDIERLSAEAAEVTGGRIDAHLEERVGAGVAAPDRLVVPLGPVVAPAQTVPATAALVLRARPMETAWLPSAWHHRPDLLVVVAIALVVSAFTTGQAAREHVGRRKLLRAVEANRVRFQDFSEIASDWYWELDPDFRFTAVFGSFEESMGLTADQIVGRHYRDILSAHADPRSLRDPAWGPLLTKALDAREAVSDLTLGWIRPDGVTRVFRINARPVFDQRGRFVGYRGTAVDQTSLVEAQEAVAHARDAAEKALAFKTRFMAGVSHDLQQPLLSIGLFANQLLLPDRPEAVPVLAQRIRQTSECASAMLMQLHELSRLEGAAIRPSRQPIPLAEMLAELADEFDVLCDEKNLCLRVLCPEGAVVRSDPMALARILRNLLSNAVRYTAEGVVLLTVRRRPEHHLVQVWDTGRGIPEEDLPFIFEENWRGRDTGGEPGLGLGLAVVQRAATLLGHPLRVASRPGRGTVFSLLVPKAVNAGVRRPIPAAPSSPPGSGSGRQSSGKYSEDATSP